MGINFPNAPTLGQKYPSPPVAGIPVYSWDGEKWTTLGGSMGGKTPVFTDGTTAMTAGLSLVAPPVFPTDAAAKSYVDMGVRADVVQALSASQQAIARSNIYAAPFDALAYNGLQINGSFDVSQEHGFQAVTSGVMCDGWSLLTVGTMVVSGSKGANAFLFPGLPNFLNLTTPTAQSSLAADNLAFVWQSIEGYRASRLVWGNAASAKPITIGFWSAHHRPGVYSVAVRNSAADRSYVATYTHNAPDVGQYNIVTVPPDTTGTWLANNGVGVTLSFAQAAGANFQTTAGVWTAGNFVAAPNQVNAVAATADVFRITGVIVVPGIEVPSATRSPFIMRSFDQELLLCKRYWQRLGGSGLGDIFISGYQAAGSGLGGTLNYEVEMRAIPTAIFSGVWVINNVTSIYALGIGAKSLGLMALAGTSGVVYAYTTDASCFINLDARL